MKKLTLFPGRRGLMRTLVLSNLFPSATEPTRGVFNCNRFQALAQYCDVRVVSPAPWWRRVRRPHEWWTPPRDTVGELDAVYPTFWSIPGHPQLHGRGMYLSLRASIRRLRREFPFEVILAAWAYPDGVAAAHLAREMGVPLVTMVLGSDINELPRHPALRKQIREGLLYSRRIVAVSGALQQQLLQLEIPASRVVVQRNGVDGKTFRIRSQQEVRQHLGLDVSGPIVCYVGNLSPEKGVNVLLEAMLLLKTQGHSGITLLLVGDGTLESELKAFVEREGIEGQVRFCGRRPHAEIPDWISAADVLCLPSFREGCPNVVLEALASGRPVVASSVGGVPELLDDGTGALVPPGDREALAAALATALDRTWDPVALRNSVQYLSWNQFGLTLRDTLAAAIPAS